ncbi:flavodoxin [Anaerocolumna cellulosilytica]|uniref:Flavodoxin n=1 Tax=Anaerocolumna cellulosilytica TaxID=433286 RepID=A0A6S6R205_9FIRM|nr:flavodoxin [Anaerocolumna cellulosilytica]MBB5197156.1 flavodoxin [Anaerocolumna cellulosilytica]BCJ95369.1 flavodoxin [Anaerocolumna cellulosilytica]
MKTLVVYYSLEGDTKFIADLIAEELDSDILELKPQKEVPKDGFKKFIWGGKSVLFKEKPKLVNIITNFEEYDTIFIGTPIWASSYAPPISTFLSNVTISGKKLGFFACHAGGGAEKCFNKLSVELKDNTLLGTIDLVDPLKEDREKVKTQVKRWLHEVT